MQSLSWYYRRLRTMSPAEVTWRINSLARDIVDVVRLKLDLFPKVDLPARAKSHQVYAGGYSAMPDTSDGEDVGSSFSLDGTFEADLIHHANQILEHKLTFFDLNAKFLGDPIDWHKDHSSGKRAELRAAPFVNYRDYRSVGDCKLVWEPNRHHHLVVLARAWKLTGQQRYANEVAAQLTSWLDQNPFGYGMNWRSPLELGIRVINWVWSLDLIKDSQAIPDELWERIYRSAYLHCWDISRKFSQDSSANNHLIGEAAGVYIAISYFPDFPDSDRLRQMSKEVLEREIQTQSYSDGCNREQALGYQFFVMQFLTIAALVAERKDDHMSAEYLKRLHAEYRFIALLSDGGSKLPMFGDRDDGYVLDLGNSIDSTDSTLAIGACLFDDNFFASKVRRWPESPTWLFPKHIVQHAREKSGDAKNTMLTSYAFKQSGYYLLQCGEKDRSSSVSMLFDCGELGFGSLAAHGHADALSFSLRIGGKAFLVDPGTYDYFTYPEWRNYFRSTRAHNTVEVDGCSQSRITGSFMWGNRAKSQCLSCNVDSNSPSVRGSHDGYESLQDPVQISRTVQLNKIHRKIIITDDLIANRSHHIAIFFHVDSAVEVNAISSNSFELVAGRERSVLTIDPSLQTSVIDANDDEYLGWISSAYHVKTKSKVILARLSISSSTSFVHIIDID